MIKQPTTSQRLTTTEDRLAAIEKEQESMKKILLDLGAKLRAVLVKLGIVEDSPAPAPAPAPGPVVPPPAPILRDRAVITNIFLDELAKLTSYVPGGSSGSATPAEIQDPKRAVQLWTTLIITEMGGLTKDESDLRSELAARLGAEVTKYRWAEKYPPSNIPVLPASDIVVVDPVVPQPAEPSLTGVWTDAQIEEAIRQMRQPNQARIMNVDNSKPGWYSRGQVVMGGHLTEEGAPSWAPKTGQTTRFWKDINWWGVLFSGEGNTVADAMAEVMDQEIQLLYRDAVAWIRLSPKNAYMVWGEIYQANMIHSFSPIRKLWRKPGTLPNSMSFDLPMAGSPHWIDGTGVIETPRPQDVIGVMAKMKIRLDPRGNQNAKMLCHIGADAKPGDDIRLQYYPGIMASSAQVVTKDWREITAINLESDAAGNPPQNFGPPKRAISEELLRRIRPLA